MSSLPWRLLTYEVLPEKKVLGAMRESLDTGVPFFDCLGSERGAVESWLRAEAEESGFDILEELNVDATAAAQLPAGLCQRWSALPLSAGEQVAVLPWELNNAALKQEFEFQLGRRVELVAASPEVVRQKLSEIVSRPKRKESPKASARGSDVQPIEAAPIPLVKLQTEPPRTRRGVAPPANTMRPQGVRVPQAGNGDSPPPPKPSVVPQRESVPPLETLSPSTAPPRPAAQAPMLNDAAHSPQAALTDPSPAGEAQPSAPRSPVPMLGEPIEPALAALEIAQNPQAVVQALAQGAHALAARVLVFAVRNQMLHLKADVGAKKSDGDEVVIRPSRLSLLGRVVQEHLAFGLLSRHPDDQTLAQLLDDPEQVGLAAAFVGGRPALLVALAEFEDKNTARQLSKLSDHAALSLARIIQERRSR